MSGTCLNQGTGRAGSGSLTKLGRLGGASLQVKACQHPEIPQGSAGTRLAVLPSGLPNICLHHTEMTSFGTGCFLDSGELQGWKSRSGDHDASAELCDKGKPYGLKTLLSLRMGSDGAMKETELSQMTEIHPTFPLSLLFLVIKYHRELFERLTRAVPELWKNSIIGNEVLTICPMSRGLGRDQGTLKHPWSDQSVPQQRSKC